MKNSFAPSIDLVLIHEGGFVDHPHDPGGATTMGITQGTLSEWRGYPVSKQDVKALGIDEVHAIYKAKYWDNVRGDDLPAGLDYAVFDYAVNSGVSRAARVLQRHLGVTQDGMIGPMTLRAVERVEDVERLINEICDYRLQWLQRLRHWKTFGRGWARRVAGVKKAARLMVRGV